ncbi:MAG TPA: argininosuccinate lyase [Phycisphaerales bacterium]|nr:argininosuccinate lyase [Phycisphaerales bacterium]
MALWGGRFDGGPDPLFRELNDSLAFDAALAREDIEGSLGWARALHRAGVLTAAEASSLARALESLREEVAADPGAPVKTAEGDEDIHSWVERRLIETVGPLGKKLHTGRSRNDQVATDLRLWTRRAIAELRADVRAARVALIDFADRHRAAVIPGYTHLQRAQPVLLAHWALAYEQMLSRDDARLRDALARVNICPLGSGALAGTAYPIDREALAKDLGFAAASANSLDAVSDRDFAVETLAALSIMAVHLSRLGEDLVLYGSGEFAFFEYDDAFSSGSSLMPQKKNPDAAELLRAKSGRIVGSLVTLLTVLKGLPLAYNKDLQEDKEPLFDAVRHARLCLRAAARILAGVTVRADAARRAAQGGYSNATDLADYLVGKGVPFRDAHEQAGRCVRAAIEAGKPLEEMTAADLRAHAPAIADDVFRVLSIDAGLARRDVPGGTGPNAVAAAIKAAHDRVSAE